jgi:hypothetical protein
MPQTRVVLCGFAECIFIISPQGLLLGVGGAHGHHSLGLSISF